MRLHIRHVVALVLVAATSVAGCAGRARPGTPAATPPGTPPVTRVDSVVPVTAGVIPTRPDSAVAIPTLPPGRDTVVRPVVGDTSRRAVVADSTARADSLAARRTAATARPAPTSRQCVLDFTESPPETRLTFQSMPDGTSNTFIGGGFVGHCQGERNRLRADSAEQYQTAGVVNLFGNVTYEEPEKVRLQASHAVYFTREQRLIADGNVTATQLASGSTFTGPNIEYLRPLAGVRTGAVLIAPNRPTASIIEKDSTGKPGPPITIVANTMRDEGDTLLYAWGTVNIKRNRLTGDADSASYEKLTERARLIRQARVTNNDSTQPFSLVGDTIDLFNRERTVERVLALHKATASNADFVMQAERIDLRLADQKLNRAYASGKGRAKATTPQQDLVADSIAIFLPGQRIREVRAIGTAVATGVPDTLKLKSEDRDVLRGDTVIAQFDTARVPADTSKQAKIREIQAQGSASSLFQVPSKLGPAFPPAVNYLRAKNIVVAFDTNAVRTVIADSSASGLYLEPATDSVSDTSTARPRGTTGAPPRGGPPGPATPVRPPARPPNAILNPVRRQ